MVIEYQGSHRERECAVSWRRKQGSKENEEDEIQTRRRREGETVKLTEMKEQKECERVELTKVPVPVGERLSLGRVG